MTTVYYDSADNDQQRRERLYSGDIYVYSPTDAGRALVQFARSMCKEAFHPHFPPNAQHHLKVDDYVERLKRLKPGFIHHPDCKELLPELLKELGCNADETYYDVPRLRTACTTDYLSSGLAYAFKPHRDTWYSTPMSQLNWWIPIYPVTTDNCMAFHPHYWDRSVRNSSAGFNYQDWNNVGRKQAHHQGKVDNRVQSEALEPVELDPQLRLICEPGGVIVFSAAHLHSTVPNTSGQTRISIDFRTVHQTDLVQFAGAPNQDGESTGTTTHDYLRCRDNSHLPDELIQQYEKLVPNPIVPNHFNPEQSVHPS